MKYKDLPELYLKFGGRCAYCGKEISKKSMVIDHLVSKQRAEALYGSVDAYERALGVGINDRDNLMPCCRLCKHFKGTMGLEAFRSRIEGIPERLGKESALYKVGIDFGFFSASPWNVEFYYEKLDRNGKTAEENNV